MTKQLTSRRSGNNSYYMWYPAANSSAKHCLMILIPRRPAQLSLAYHSAINRKWGGTLGKSLHSLLSGCSFQE